MFLVQLKELGTIIGLLNFGSLAIIFVTNPLCVYCVLSFVILLIEHSACYNAYIFYSLKHQIQYQSRNEWQLNWQWAFILYCWVCLFIWLRCLLFSIEYAAGVVNQFSVPCNKLHSVIFFQKLEQVLLKLITGWLFRFLVICLLAKRGLWILQQTAL